MAIPDESPEREQMEFASAVSTLTNGRGGRAASAAATALKVVAIVLRICAAALCALVVADAFFAGPGRGALLGVNGLVTQLIPAPLSGILVVSTPFGGVYRGDFAIAAIIVFVIDWLLTRASASLR